MKKLLVVLASVVIVISGCAILGASIPQDKPLDSTQCFEGKFNVHRIVAEHWKPIYNSGNMWFVKNPNKGYPKVVALLIHPQIGLIVRYAYLDGKIVAAYKFQVENGRGCYVADTLDQQERDYLENKIHILSKESLAKN